MPGKMHVARRLGLIGQETPKYSVEDVKEEFGKALLADAIAWLDSKGYYSFRLHSLEN